MTTSCIPRWLQGGAIAIALILALYLLDRVATWMESLGWIYWRKSQGNASRVGNAFLEIQALVEPEKKHVLEAKYEIKRPQKQAGAPPDEVESDRDRESDRPELLRKRQPHRRR